MCRKFTNETAKGMCLQYFSNFNIHILSNSEHLYAIRRLEIGKNHAHLQKGPHYLAVNYRPLSVTSVICQTTEHIMYSHIAEHLEMNNILTPRQHGFRRNYSCETKQVTTIDDWAKTIDRQQQTDVMTLNFSKAFDVVAHQRLLSKLSSYGIRIKLHTWVASFLANRQQRVDVGVESSQWVPVSSGVPQGKVVGPLLFLIIHQRPKISHPSLDYFLTTVCCTAPLNHCKTANFSNRIFIDLYNGRKMADEIQCPEVYPDECSSVAVKISRLHI